MLPLLLACILLFSACGSREAEETGVIHLTYAVLSEKAANEARAEINRFNRTHPDIEISVVEYFNENGRRGGDRLLAEVMAGKFPDIIHLGGNLLHNDQEDAASRLSYYTLARKGYLEDLWPYIENDADLGREGILEAPLEAAEVDGGLYTIFDKVTIQTVVTPESLAGSRKGWTLAEALEAFHAMPEDAVMFPSWTGRDFAFEILFSNSIESYVDRNTGTCRFTGDQFKTALEFVRSFPVEGRPSSDAAVQEELANQVRSGLLMQYPANIANPSYLQWLDAYLGRGGNVVFVGVPTEDGSTGNYFRLTSKPLAMSSACRHKEAAWEFLRETLLPKYPDLNYLQTHSESFTYLPVNRSDYDLIIKASRLGKHAASSAQIPGFPPVSIRRATQEEIDRFEDLLSRTDRIDLYDEDIYNIVYEAAGAYFAGDKTLDETAQLIQDRVRLYLTEQM